MKQLLTSARFHTILAIAWAAALIPTLLWWKESILWVASMSLYANFVGHWSAREAAQAKEEAQRERSGVDTPSPGSDSRSDRNS